MEADSSDETNYYDDDYDEDWDNLDSLFSTEPDWNICPACDGLGTDNWDSEKLCARCDGEGELPVVG